jgi:hypothetical protein
MDVASLNLTCRPVARGVQCQLLALLRSGTLAPRDVTASASWHVAGTAGMHVSPEGMVATGDGDVLIDTDYQSKTARLWIRLTPHHPAQLLGTVQGSVYLSVRGWLRPVAHARVEVVSGPSLGKQTTTRDDGTYELPAVVPGDIVIRATKNGFVPTELAARIWPGDNRISVAIAVAPPIKVSAYEPLEHSPIGPVNGVPSPDGTLISGGTHDTPQAHSATAAHAPQRADV